MLDGVREQLVRCTGHLFLFTAEMSFSKANVADVTVCSFEKKEAASLLATRWQQNSRSNSGIDIFFFLTSINLLSNEMRQSVDTVKQ